jgi:gp16 family phage-associated protein
MSLAVSNEIKIEFLKKGKSIRKWSEENGFTAVMVLYVLSGKAKGDKKGKFGGEKVKKIINALKRDFPEIFEKGLIKSK